MRLSFNALLMGIALTGTLFSGCDKDDNDPNNDSNTDDLMMIASDHTNGGSMQVKLYAKQALFAGYNHLFIEVRDSASNELIDDAHISLSPMMDMQTMTHSAPYEDPAEEAVDGLFPCAVVFQMPGEMGWTLDISIHEHVNGGSGTVQFPLSVAQPEEARVHVVTPLNGSNPLIISYVEPSAPEVGINDMKVTLHQRETMMSFPAVENYTVSIEPEMPSMGHGSPNNVDPVHTENGHYEGQVNFTMTGFWRIHLDIMDGTEVVDSTAYFDVTFQ